MLTKAVWFQGTVAQQEVGRCGVCSGPAVYLLDGFGPFIHSSSILWAIYQVFGARLDAKATEMNRTVFLFLRNFLFSV